MKNEKNLKRPHFLEGARIFLTPLSIEDTDLNFAWDNDPELSYLDGGVFRPKSIEKTRDEISKAVLNNKMLIFSIIIIESGEHMGNIVLFNMSEYNRSAHWGIKIDKIFWRQKYATEAARLLIRYAFKSLGLNKLRSGAHENNIGSIRLQESLGFIKEGVFRKERYIRGEYYDDIRFGMLKEEFEKLLWANK
ncbi:MAG: GNAT family protein [candidate division Zixibacteria bacterium]